MARILIAEDDHSMRRFLEMALKKAGHDVVAVEDGLQALEQIKTQGEDAPRFNLLLTDIVMPGMDGVELSRHAMEACSDLKVIFITGFAAVTMGQNSSPVNNAKVLSKPFHLNDLVSQVETVLKAA